jgi:hypothetical protein
MGGKKHLGEDWNSEYSPTDDEGKPVFAIADGTVIYAADAGPKWNGVVIIHHQAPNGAVFVLPDRNTVSEVWSMYAHLDVSKINAWVTIGSEIKKNNQIGIIGPAPEGSTGPHLHFEIRDTNPPDLVGPGYSFDTAGWVKPSTFILRNEVARWKGILIDMPPPDYQPMNSFWGPLLSRIFKRQGYDELYFSALKMRNVAAKSLTYANKALDQYDDDDANKYIEQAKRQIELIPETDSTAIQIWNGQVDIASEFIHSIYEATRASVIYGTNKIAPGSSLVVEMFFLPFDYVNDKIMYGEDVAIRNIKNEILEMTVNSVFETIPIKSLNGKTIHEWIKKGVNHEIGASRIYAILDELVQNPDLQKEIMQALSFFASELSQDTIDRLAIEMVKELRDAVDVSGEPIAPSTFPARTAANVSPQLQTVTIDLNDTTPVDARAITITTREGNPVPVSQVTLSANTVTLSLADRLTPGTNYVVHNVPHWDNDRFDWAFTTAPQALHVGASVLVANTGQVGLHLRSTPRFLDDGSNIIATLPEGTPLTIIAGPELADGYTWWQVTDTTRTGWSAVGDWLVPTDDGGLRVGAMVTVENTSGLGLRLRDAPGLDGTYLTTLSEGTPLTITGGPFFIDGFIWWNVAGTAGTGWSAVAYWLALDNTRPSVNLTTPADGTTVSGEVPVTVAVSNEVTQVAFYLDNSLRFTDSSRPFSWSWDTTLTSDSPHSLMARAYDEEGNMGQSPPVSVTVHNGTDTPCTDSYEPNDSSTQAFGPLTPGASIHAKICDGQDIDWFKMHTESSGVINLSVNVPYSNDYDLELYGPSGRFVAGSYSDEGQPESIAYTATTTGTYYGRVYGYPEGDGSYNTTSPYTLTYNFGTTGHIAPSVTLGSPNGGENWLVGSVQDITWTATDNTGVTSVSLFYSTDGGVNWERIDEGLGNSGSYPWTIPDAPSTTVRVRVVAYNEDGMSGEDQSNSTFTIAQSCSRPPAPSLYDPGIYSETGAYTLRWGNVSTAVSYYILQESTSSSFTSNLVEYTVSPMSQSVSGKPNGFYYYRVKAVNDCGGFSDWSNTVDMEVRQNQPPIIPHSPNPSDGQANITRDKPILSWRGGDPDGSVEYAVRFGTEPKPVIVAGFGAINGTSYQIPSILEAGTTYYWGVKARDDKGVEVESPIWRFTTEYTYPDLIPVSLTVDGQIGPNVQVTLDLLVKNQGTFPALGGGQVLFYYSTSSGGREQFLGEASIPELTAEEQVTIPQPVTLSHLQAGQSYIDVWIKTSFPESDVTNNILSYPVSYQDDNAPIITFLKLSGTIFKTGYTYYIIYEVSDDIAVTQLDFSYSLDNGMTWEAIATGVEPGPGNPSISSYAWGIPIDTTLTDALKVKVVAWDASGNSDEATAGPYTLVSGVAPTVGILSPNGGEVWDMGSTHDITWEVDVANEIAGIRH